MSATAPPLPAAAPPPERWPEPVADEAAFFCATVAPSPSARVVELGCGNAAFARTLLARGAVREVVAFEVDRVQHTANLAAPPVEGLRFVAGGAEAVPLPDAGCDIVVMLKSLHHVPADRLDAALAEAARILVAGGLLYVSEPVYAGPFNEIMKLFHDEGAVRAAAVAALQRAVAAGRFVWAREVTFDAPVAFASYADFVDRTVRVTHSDLTLTPAVEAEVRARYAAHADAAGAARFMRPMRVDFLRKPG